jgi:hypothetical protein
MRQPIPQSLNLHQNDLLFHIGCSSPVNAACGGWVQTGEFFTESGRKQTGSTLPIEPLRLIEHPTGCCEGRAGYRQPRTGHVSLQICNNPRAVHSNSTVPQITHYTSTSAHVSCSTTAAHGLLAVCQVCVCTGACAVGAVSSVWRQPPCMYRATQCTLAD